MTTNWSMLRGYLFCLDFMTGAKSQSPKGNKEQISLLIFPFSRKQIPVDEIFVHENFTSTGDKANDIALIRLGEYFHNKNSAGLIGD